MSAGVQIRDGWLGLERCPVIYHLPPGPFATLICSTLLPRKLTHSDCIIQAGFAAYSLPVVFDPKDNMVKENTKRRVRLSSAPSLLQYRSVRGGNCSPYPGAPLSRVQLSLGFRTFLPLDNSSLGMVITYCSGWSWMAQRPSEATVVLFNREIVPLFSPF